MEGFDPDVDQFGIMEAFGESFGEGAGGELVPKVLEEIGGEAVEEIGAGIGTEIAKGVGTEIATQVGTEVAKEVGTQVATEGAKEVTKGALSAWGGPAVDALSLFDPDEQNVASVAGKGLKAFGVASGWNPVGWVSYGAGTLLDMLG